MIKGDEEGKSAVDKIVLICSPCNSIAILPL